jgi:hypothetical protein
VAEARDESANPLRGHIVRFPQAIPSQDWLAQRMLWADQLGAVWPLDAPHPSSDSEEQALEAIRTYQAAGYFTPCSVPWGASTEMLKQIRASLGLSDSRIGTFVRSMSTAAFEHLNPDAAVEPMAIDPDQYFYINKFPQEIQKALLASRVATREGGMLRIGTISQAKALLATLAEHAQPNADVNLPRTLETPDPDALARAAAPTRSSGSRPAIMLDIPVVRGVTEGVVPQRLVEFRQRAGTEDARQDYLNSVGQYVSKATTRDPSSSAASVLHDRLTRDLQLASKSWYERAKSAGMASVALSTVGTIVPLPSFEGTADWVGGITGAAGVGVAAYTAVRNSHVHGYLTAARRADVFAQPGT